MHTQQTKHQQTTSAIHDVGREVTGVGQEVREMRQTVDTIMTTILKREEQPDKKQQDKNKELRSLLGG